MKDPEAFFTKTSAAIDALPTYKHWTAMLPDTSVPGGYVPLRICVPLAMQLSAEENKPVPRLVKIGTGMFVHPGSKVLTDEISGYQSTVTTSAIRMTSSEGRDMSGDELREMKIEELKEGTRSMQKKFHKLYLEYYRAPHVIMFMTVAGMGGAVTRWIVALVLRHNGTIIPEAEHSSY